MALLIGAVVAIVVGLMATGAGPARDRALHPAITRVVALVAPVVAAGEGDIRNACEARAGCEFQPGNCYCPPGLNCARGGGTPVMCVERR